MSRDSAQVKCIGTNALPSPDNTSDSDSEVLNVLDQKRREVDEEIARFRAAKDREFREFERELRVKKHRSRTGAPSGSGRTPTASSTSATATVSVLNLLASAQNGAVNGRGHEVKRDGSLSDGSRKPVPLSGPTLSLDKLNIRGETTPPLHSLGTPPTPSLLKRTKSQSPQNLVIRPSTPPSSHTEKELVSASTPTPSRDKADPFAGVFTPAYLPLLESRDQHPAMRSPQLLSSAAEEEERLQLDADSRQQAENRKLEASQSLPPQQVSPTIIANKRAKSTSILPNSASLPSALRTPKGEGRSRKHVMFQLADLKVVDPSSSYEEGPSPELEDINDKSGKYRLGTPSGKEDDRADKKGNLSPRINGKEKKRGRHRGGRFISPVPSPLASPNPSPRPSPALRGVSPGPLSPPPLTSPDESGFSGGLNGADDGGSSVGFFELDEELASPALRDGKPAEGFDVDIPEDDLDEKSGARAGLGIESVPSVQVGSVPINIVRSGSWIGSYGH